MGRARTQILTIEFYNELLQWIGMSKKLLASETTHRVARGASKNILLYYFMAFSSMLRYWDVPRPPLVEEYSLLFIHRIVQAKSVSA